MFNDEIPSRTRSQHALPILARDDAMAGRLILMSMQHLGIEIGRGVTHGTRGGERGGVRVRVGRAGRFEDLVLGRGFLELQFESLVLGADGVRVGF